MSFPQDNRYPSERDTNTEDQIASAGALYSSSKIADAGHTVAVEHGRRSYVGSFELGVNTLDAVNRDNEKVASTTSRLASTHMKRKPSGETKSLQQLGYTFRPSRCQCGVCLLEHAVVRIEDVCKVVGSLNQAVGSSRGGSQGS